MLEKVIQEIQKFINTAFKYKDLLVLLDKKREFLLRPEILEKIPDEQYNAIWDTFINLEKYFKFADNENIVIVTDGLSISKIFEFNIKERTKK